MPVGARLAEMARIRLQYDETRQQVQDIQQVNMMYFEPAVFHLLTSFLYIFTLSVQRMMGKISKIFNSIQTLRIFFIFTEFGIS